MARKGNRSMIHDGMMTHMNELVAHIKVKSISSAGCPPHQRLHPGHALVQGRCGMSSEHRSIETRHSLFIVVGLGFPKLLACGRPGTWKIAIDTPQTSDDKSIGQDKHQTRKGNKFDNSTNYKPTRNRTKTKSAAVAAAYSDMNFNQRLAASTWTECFNGTSAPFTAWLCSNPAQITVTTEPSTPIQPEISLQSLTDWAIRLT